jgi:signal transduction histidine kinase
MLRVANSGPRVPPGQVPLLFEPFGRHPASRTADGTGHGLGLSIAAAIVAAHHSRYDARPPGRRPRHHGQPARIDPG